MTTSLDEVLLTFGKENSREELPLSTITLDELRMFAAATFGLRVDNIALKYDYKGTLVTLGSDKNIKTWLKDPNERKLLVTEKAAPIGSRQDTGTAPSGFTISSSVRRNGHKSTTKNCH
jgi:hypothetical protein